MRYFTLFVIIFVVYNVYSFPQYKPGDVAPSFLIQTLHGKLVYKAKALNDSKPSDPIIFCAFNKHSAFLRALWTEEGSVRRLLERSPRNTQFVFLSFDENAKHDVQYMRRKIFGEMERLYNEKKDKLIDSQETDDISKDEGMLQRGTLMKRSTTASQKQTMANKQTDMLNMYSDEINIMNEDNGMKEDLEKLKKDHSFGTGQPLSLHDKEHSEEDELVKWKKQFHFASFPLFEFGNWIPFVMARWPCLGTGCGLPQVALKNSEGDILRVVPRLEARYDWQPMPFRTLVKRQKTRLRYIRNACDNALKRSKSAITEVALVSSEGGCSTFQKIQNVAKTGVKFVLIYAKKNEPVKEIKCEKEECFHLLGASAAMISFEDGDETRGMMEEQDLFVELQTTSQDNFFFAIDHRGRLAEVGLFLYPSLHFLAYEAQWFQYESDLMQNTKGHAKIVYVFNHTTMQGVKGASNKIHLPKDFLKYRNVELDMSLRCPHAFDSSCPHWDHVVHLTVCCEKESPLCGSEIGRWITPYARSIGRWLTPITPLLPLFTSSTCTLTMKTVPWEMPWKPSLSIRFSDHISDSKHGYSTRRYSHNLVPYKIMKLFRGGTFDKTYNDKYKDTSFYPPRWTKKVELVAIITGHGKDNFGCAEFCVTSHHFTVNDVSPNVRVFKNAATAMGCAERVDRGVEPNEHGTWLYGRDGWCPGQEVVSWVTDITKQVHLKGENTIKYFGYFNGTDPHPRHSPGSIDMSSYLVFYRLATDLV